ncbi:TetR/AcrR family transcriptional regulator [Gordonia sp. L191]|uniref:TetR/AcrR family transcriptional regulator n=1 Tax=Gordonia sp. L191 TaxID=2982699 RepID=UPI0024C00E2F|nr:TetR/AcrR family transcriptional regulator [Gordonia sp. L191]WHU49136.1 TetR/AcrR family transcriptional regulator [Gordonia sp. L191]
MSKSSEGIPRVRAGVFFTSTPPIPRGPHGLDRTVVTSAHRERLLIAMTELVAAQGYRNTRVADIASRAAVSKSTFYESFPNKDACANAGYNRFIDVLITALAGRLRDAPNGSEVAAVLDGYLDTLANDLVVARAYQCELEDAGVIDRPRRRDALLRLAELLRLEQMRRAEHDPTLNAELPVAAFLGAIYATRQLASDELSSTTEPDLRALSAELKDWLVAGFRRIPEEG